MSNLTAIRQAYATYLLRETLDQQGRLDSAIALAEWGIYSNRHIASFTGLHPSFVAEITGKKDRTGGRLNPEALPLIARLIVDTGITGAMDSGLVAQTLDAGVSAHLLARFTGMSQVTLSRRARAWRDAR